MSPGERKRRQRARERKRAAALEILSKLPIDACCGNCKHLFQIPLETRTACELNSDYEGYSIVRPDHKPCTGWKRCEN